VVDVAALVPVAAVLDVGAVDDVVPAVDVVGAAVVATSGALVVLVSAVVVEGAVVDVVVVSGPVQWAAAVVVGADRPGMTTVPAHPKFESVVVRVMLLPSAKRESTVASRMKPAPSMPIFSSVVL
jgi:hypothetical protein